MYIVTMVCCHTPCYKLLKEKKKNKLEYVPIYIVMIGVDVTIDKNKRDIEWTKKGYDD